MSRQPPPRTPQTDLFPPLGTFYSPSSPLSIREATLPSVTSNTSAGSGLVSGPGSGPSNAVDAPLPALTGTASASSATTATTTATATATATTTASSYLTSDRRPSLPQKSASFSTLQPPISGAFVTNTGAPPSLPSGYAHRQNLPPIITRDRERERDFDQIRSATSEDSFARMLTRTTTASSMAQQVPPLPPPTPVGGASTTSANGGGTFWQPGDVGTVHQHIVDQANKRISTFDYLRKVHEGRVHWFNAYLFDRPDLARMPSLDQRKLSRRATNYLLLGLSLPVVIDLYSTSPLEFLRSLSALLSEFDSFQQLRNDSSSSASLARARLPNMFRRPGTRGRRSTSATDNTASDTMYAASNGGGGAGGAASGNGGANVSSAVRNFAASESELLPGEEYSYLLTPALPFEPDYFETFATLCDVLIECYSRFLSLIVSPRDCNASVAELFTKADARLRKILVQGVAKEFEDSSRANIKTEIAGIGKTVLSGLM